MTADFAAIRRDEFPIAASATYLDNAARGPLPRSHVAAVTAYLQEASAEMPARDSALLIEETRERAARLLNCTAADVALLATTSQGVNLVPGGLDWRSGDEVILYEMDHPTDIYAWLNLADRGVTARFVKDRGGRYTAEDVEALEKKLKERGFDFSRKNCPPELNALLDARPANRLPPPSTN